MVLSLTQHMDTFIKERCNKKSKDFFDPLKRINTETFSKLTECIKYECKDKHWLQIEIFLPG